jgi:hypothetical protein
MCLSFTIKGGSRNDLKEAFRVDVKLSGFGRDRLVRHELHDKIEAGGRSTAEDYNCAAGYKIKTIF